LISSCSFEKGSTAEMLKTAQHWIGSLCNKRHLTQANLHQLISIPANEGLVRIQYKCLVSIYAFPEMKLRGLVNSKTEL
jgi:hypothetical protein